MPILEALIGPIAAIIDKVIPDKAQRDKAKLELLQLQGSQDLELLQARLSAIVAEANSHDPWTSRARPSFLYVMYAMLLFALPMGLIAAFTPAPQVHRRGHERLPFRPARTALRIVRHRLPWLHRSPPMGQDRRQRQIARRITRSSLVSNE